MSTTEQLDAHVESVESDRSGHSNRGLIAVIAVLVLAMASVGAWAVLDRNTGSGDPPSRLLFVGNSLTYWNDGVDHHVTELAASATPPMNIVADCYCEPGASLANLWETSRIVDGELNSAADMITSGDYDVVVLQGDVALRNNTVDSFHRYARIFDAEITAAGAETIIFMPQQTADPVSFDEVAAANEEIAAELGVDLAPVGIAWRRAGEERTELDLYEPDGTHGSIHGTYLAANVVYATVYGETASLTYVPAGITEEEASFLRRIAWETVEEYSQQP